MQEIEWFLADFSKQLHLLDAQHEFKTALTKAIELKFELALM